ncbi:hypothetical protein GCM10020369_46720 [Cryptosporangium minutisporangium]|uniref:Uncharacterized protein n=2 Tax=Cryptosporangium minutisporangium TaxID=113569 RepID=A0ABP6T2J5_9ACTN
MASFRASTAPTMTGPGGATVRAAVRRQRRRTAVVSVAAAVLALAGASALVIGPGQQTDQLVPATASSSESTTTNPNPSQDDDAWKQSVRSARVDLGTKADASCRGPVVTFQDGKAAVTYEGRKFAYVVTDGPMLSADLNQDGTPEYLVTLSCAMTAFPTPCVPDSETNCDPNVKKSLAPPLEQLFVLSGGPDEFTAIAGIHAFSRYPENSAVPIDVRIADDGLISITNDQDPGRVWTWRYRDGDMVRVQD